MKTNRNYICALIFSFSFVLLLQSCGHTNNLSEYDLTKKRILFDYETSSEIEVNSNVSNSDIKTGSNTADVIIDVAKSVGTSAVTSQAEEKLANASDPDEVASAVSESLGKSMVKYLAVKPVFDINDEFDFINNTRINKIILSSNENGIFLTVEAKVELTQRGTASVVWDYCDTETVPLNGLFDDVDKTRFDPNISDIFQLTELLAISDEKLRTAILFTASEIGRKISDVFKEDLSDS